MSVFLFFLILIFVVLPLALLSRLFGGIIGIFRRATNRDSYFGNGSSRSSSSSSSVKRKKKIFSRNDGEYVDFEEIIEEKSTAGSSTASSREEVRYEIEDQVSDAEWTEINSK